ncbi:MAG: hypothetical protein ACSHXK_03265 [Oceanococcus sp.]
MDEIKDLRITGIDETRPPRVRKEPYIDLYFTLSFQAPPLWCEMFNDLVQKGKFPAKIEPESGLMIETWVRQIDEIELALATLKQGVSKATEAYFARLKAEAAQVTDSSVGLEDGGEQGRLNRVLAALNFTDT